MTSDAHILRGGEERIGPAKALGEAFSFSERPEPTGPVLSPTWPMTGAISLGLTGALIAALALPWLLAGGGAGEVATTLLVGALGGLLLRFTYQAFSPAEGLARPWTLALAAFGSAAAATAAASAALVLPFEAPSALALLGSVVACTGILATASGCRTLELRLAAAGGKVFFIGESDHLADLLREVRRRGDMRLVGWRDITAAHELGEPRQAESIMAAGPTTLVLSAGAIRDEGLVALASDLHLRGVRVRLLNDFYEQKFFKVPVSELSAAWFLFDVAEIHRPRLYGVCKRLMETLVSASLLLVTLPLLPVVAALVRLSGPGPIFFRQQRVGKDGRLFTVTKFRTMRPDGAPPGAAWASTQAGRVTPVGKWLRKFRFDELPQLWHVLRGELSLVGPRPEQPELVESLSRAIDFYPARHRVRPGITGWAQINHDYGGSVEGALEKLQYDFYYIRRQGLRMDIGILVSTIRVILAGGGE